MKFFIGSLVAFILSLFLWAFIFWSIQAFAIEVPDLTCDGNVDGKVVIGEVIAGVNEIMQDRQRPIARSKCAGDCDGNNLIDQFDVRTVVNIQGHTQPIQACINADIDKNGLLDTIDITAMGEAQENGCPNSGLSTIDTSILPDDTKITGMNIKINNWNAKQ